MDPRTIYNDTVAEINRLSQDIDWDTEMSRSRNAFARSRSIDQQIDEEREKRQNEIQLLILGMKWKRGALGDYVFLVGMRPASENPHPVKTRASTREWIPSGASSGKSTFIKQLRLHQGDGFPESERAKQTTFVFENLTDGFNIIIDHMKDQNVPFEVPANEKFATELQTLFPKCNHYYVPLTSSPSTPGGSSSSDNSAAIPVSPVHKEFHQRHDYTKVKDYRDQLLRLCADSGLQKALAQADNFKRKLVMAEEYFLQNADRILTTGYIPTIQDILYIRKPTVGVQEHSFSIDSLSYRVIDVAGQKSQRKKWICFFEGVTAVTFFTALSGYCETLEEDPSLNSMQDSLSTFRDLVANSFLEKTDFILFLNKKDIFEQRLKKHPMKLCFPNYKGGESVETATKYIRDEFIRCKPAEKQLYVHVSTATNIDIMKKLIKDIMEIIIEINMRKVSAPF